MELEKMKERGSENTLKYTELSNEYNALKKATDKIIQTEGGVKVIDLEQQINQRKMILNPEDASMN